MKKRSVMIAGHATSISLEEEFWDELKVISCRDNVSVNKMITQIDAQRCDHNLSSAIRLYILKALKEKIASQT